MAVLVHLLVPGLYLVIIIELLTIYEVFAFHQKKVSFTFLLLSNPSSFADFSTHIIMLSMVVMISGLHGGHAVGHVLEELEGACVNVQIPLRQMVDGIVEVLVLVWRAKIVT